MNLFFLIFDQIFSERKSELNMYQNVSLFFEHTLEIDIGLIYIGATERYQWRS